MAIESNLRDTLAGYARRLDAAGKGGKGPIVQEACDFFGWSAHKFYSRLKKDIGWHSERKVRADKGSTSVDDKALMMAGAMQRESLRANGKQILFTPDTLSIMAANDLDPGVSGSQLNRLLRARKMNVGAQRNVEPVQPLRAPYPNHTHEVDPSLCVLYYLPNGQQYMMDDDKFYKNKLENYAKIKLKVWRYVIYDRASGVIYPWYVEAAGETQANLFEFLMWAWMRRPGREFCGVPKILLWDKGSANKAAAIKNMLEAMDVQSIDHKAGKARVKGGVENGNNITECKFESRLRFEPVETVEQLNAAALAWANAFNADLIPRQDNRLRREGIAPIARLDLWRLIQADQLRILTDDIEVCRAMMEGDEKPRKVSTKLKITFKHPRAERTLPYCVAGLDGICAGDEVAVRPLVFGDCAINIRVQRYDGEDIYYRLEPERNFDRFGQSLAAPTIGEQYKTKPDTAIEKVAKRMDALAYPGEDADKARDKNRTPFLNADGSTLNAHSYLQNLALPAHLPRRGSDLPVPDRLQIEVKPLNHVQMASELARLVDGWSVEMYQQMTRLYPEGCQESELQQVADRLTKAAHLGLVAVGGN